MDDVQLPFNGDGLRVSSKQWGVADDKKVYRIDLESVDGFSASFTTFGATLLSCRAGDKAGNVEEVTLQHDTCEGVLSGDMYYGSLIGRVCNRIGGAAFTVGGQKFSLAKNNGPNCLHGGAKAYDKMLWRHELIEEAGRVGVRFAYDSPDGDEGFPGDLAVKVTYTIRRGGGERGTGELHTEMEAEHIPGRKEGDIPTPINLTNHAYWNLSGCVRRSVREHGLWLACDRYLPLDENQVPTGELASVGGTPYDFTEERLLGSAIDAVGGTPPGLDNCFVRATTSPAGSSPKEGDDGEFALIARLRDQQSGRVLEVHGSQPSLQVYTANFLSTDPANEPHVRHNAVCLETQHFPDAMNHEAWYDSVLLAPGATYRERARHVFRVDA